MKLKTVCVEIMNKNLLCQLQVLLVIEKFSSIINVKIKVWKLLLLLFREHMKLNF